jgi:predicted TIM-barrel fold metal-dependent hydrolase
VNIRQDWLELVAEDILDPDRPIVDPHHHFWRQGPFGRYLLEDLWADTGSGHRVKKTVFVECHAEYRSGSPEAMRPLGETEFVAGLAARSVEAESSARVCGIVGHADLRLGAGVEDLLRAHIEAGQGLFRGIRQHASWDASDDVPKSRIDPPPHLYRDGDFREGFARLAPLGLSFDAWNFHPQIPELAALARAFPETTIVLNHLGGPLGIGPYDRRDEVFSCWQRDLSALAACANVVVKLGGIAMDLNGFGWHERDRPPTSDELAVAQRPYILHAIECFGPARCMFESNFPVEKLYVSYGVLWNAFKKIAAELSEKEKDALFRGTAERVYRLDVA